jgi:hypothetical protein
VTFPAYVQAVRHAIAHLHPLAPKTFLAEHVAEIDASASVAIVDVPSFDVDADGRGPGLDVVVSLEIVVATDRGAGDGGAADCYEMVEQMIAFAHENRWGLGSAVDPAAFQGASREGLGASTDDFYAWRVALRQALRLPVPGDLDDTLGRIVDTALIYEVYLGFDPEIGLAFKDDYVLVATVPPDAYDNGGTP